MQIVIQKFGGTSVADEKRRELVVRKVLDAKQEGYSPVVVVSAMGRKGAPYATDTLLNLLKSLSSQVNKRELDLIMSCGEVVSCCVMCATLESNGCSSTALTGGQAGIITDNKFNDASVLRVDTDTLYGLLEKDIVPVVAGFQGISEDGQITTLGRGGSDTTAAVLGEALRAAEIQIYTDVDGIMTADPRIVPDAKVIENIGYNEVFQFADQGAKVIHPRAVEFAMRGGIPIVIKNTMSDAPGTLIANYYGEKISKTLVTGIAHMPNRTQVYIKNRDDENIDDEVIFTTLAENKISIDLINVFPTHKVFTIDDECTGQVQSMMEGMGLDFYMIRNCSKVSVIGAGIRGVPGVMARIIRSLKHEGIEILQTSDSHTTIWCLVRNEDIVRSINALHCEFNLSN